MIVHDFFNHVDICHKIPDNLTENYNRKGGSIDGNYFSYMVLPPTNNVEWLVAQITVVYSI